jgi:hypothetical protein
VQRLRRLVYVDTNRQRFYFDFDTSIRIQHFSKTITGP